MTNSAIVTDSSPLIALAIIEQLELLPQLYQCILIPPAVWEEVTIKGMGLPGAQSISQVQWLEVKLPPPEGVSALSILVDRGEAEALALAQIIPNSIVLLDDAQARRVAERLGIPRIGTLGILRRAKNLGLIDKVKPYIERLEASGIYIHINVIKAVLSDLGEL